MRTPPLTTSPLTPLFCNIIILFPQIWFLLRLLHAHRVPLLALLPGVQDASQLQRQALPRGVSPRHVGGAHEDPQGCQVKDLKGFLKMVKIRVSSPVRFYYQEEPKIILVKHQEKEKSI